LLDDKKNFCATGTTKTRESYSLFNAEFKKTLSKTWKSY
jgi:hypothetical protein